MGTADITVIVPSFNSRRTIAECLRALEMQVCRHGYEIIVVDSSGDDTCEIIRHNFPDVSLYSFSERKFPGEARNIGATKARSRILAFTDSDCIVDPDWIEKIMEAHRGPSPLIGGVIDNGNPDSCIGWGHYFSEFSRWMPRTPSGHLEEVPGGCLSIKRWAFDKYGPFPEGILSEDTVLNWRFKDREKPLFVSGIRVRHVNETNIVRLLRKHATHGRFFAAARVAEGDFSALRRGLYVLISPLLPFLLFYRTCRRVIRRKMYLKEFVAASPVVFLSLVSWSWGEFRGYLSKRRTQPEST
jgi:glycosyltransferase involved in cell wall biosynthesis